jgi:uncharacterized membrane protein
LRSGGRPHYVDRSLEQISMKISCAFVLMLAAGAAQAAPVAQKPANSASTTPNAAPAAKRFPGVSDEGNAILAKAQSAPDPQQQAIVKQVRAAHDQVIAAVMAPTIDVDKVATALRAEEAAQAQVRTHNTDRLIAVLRQLPNDDKGTFLRTLVLSRQQRAPGTPAAAAGGSSPQP